MGSPVTVSFRNLKITKKTAVDAYMWMVERFHRENRDIFDLYTKKGDKRRDFAHSPEELFPGDPTQAHISGRAAKIPGTNWYVMTHTKTPEKLERLLKLAEIGGFVRGIDWTWEEK
jgi:negative regulator of replication initiation